MKTKGFSRELTPITLEVKSLAVTPSCVDRNSNPVWLNAWHELLGKHKDSPVVALELRRLP
jgi:hypothetical protein